MPSAQRDRMKRSSKPLNEATLGMLEEIDNLASHVGVTSHTLYQYATRRGTYRQDKKPRSDAWLPQPGSEQWEILAREVLDIEEKWRPLGATAPEYSIQRRAFLSRQP